MNARLLAAAAVAGCAAAVAAQPATAQSMDHTQHMPGMTMPRLPAPQSAPPTPACTPEHAAMGHCTLKPAADSHAGHGAMPAPPASGQTVPPCTPEHAAMGHCTLAPAPATGAMPGMGAGGTALPAGDAPAPAAPEVNYADRVWGRAAMAPSRTELRREHGGGTLSQIMLNLAEARVRDGRDGYHWDGEAWFGGDVDRVTAKSEGEGVFRQGVESAEGQLLYSRAVGPYFNLQAGVRHDFASGPDRTYATLGFEGLAPYWFEVEGALFVSDKGDVLGRLEGYYDQRITQRLILQPRAEINLAAQDVPASAIGSGVTDAELGVRLRYEIVREFAPYVGVAWERKFGDTARFVRAAGEGTGGFSFVAGVRAWF